MNPVTRQRGIALLVVLLILVVISILGAGSAQIALLSERGARNDRDMQLAWQAAEAALQDAELEIHGPTTASQSRTAFFAALQNTNAFLDGCGLSGDANAGLCSLALSGQPAWLTVDFTQTGATARTVEFGSRTGQMLPLGSSGAQLSQLPRYVIEAIPDPDSRNLSAAPAYIYRITAMGFGPRKDIQAMSQSLYRN